MPKKKAPAHRPREPRSTAFASWWDESGMHVDEVAKAIKVTRATVYNFRNGHSKPGRRVAADIEILSGGAVPVSCWDEKGKRR